MHDHAATADAQVAAAAMAVTERSDHICMFTYMTAVVHITKAKKAYAAGNVSNSQKTVPVCNNIEAR